MGKYETYCRSICQLLIVRNRFRFDSVICSQFPESGRLEFEEFVTLAAKFIVEEDAEALEKELREAFRLYDKEGRHSCNRAMKFYREIIIATNIPRPVIEHDWRTG